MFDFPFQEHPEYSSRLVARLDSAVIVPRAEAHIGDWKPVKNDCHANVSTWCKNREGFQAVRGWLYFDLNNVMPIVLFNAHSVVRDEHGQLWDITPTKATDTYPFLIAEESEEAYAKFIEGGAGRLRHRK